MGVKKLWQIVSDFVFSNTNRDFLVFLFFLGLSGIFWLSLTLNETYEREFSIPVTAAHPLQELHAQQRLRLRARF